MVKNNNTEPRYLIQILLDQSSPEAFFGLIDQDIAPHISKYILGKKKEDGTYENACISRNIVTGYPSTSANSHTSIITGSYAGKNNLLYTTYWNLTGKEPKYVDTEKISLKGLKEMNKVHINPLCKTLFEYLDNSASFHAINRGATFKLLTLKSIIFNFLPLLLKVKRTLGSEGVEPMSSPEFWKRLFDDNISKFLKRIQEKNSVPTGTFIVFLFSDDMGHRYGFNSKEYQTAIELLDYLIKCIVEGLNDKKGNFIQGIKELGFLKNTIWNICTDHAARPVLTDKFVFIDSIIKKEFGLKLVDGEIEKFDYKKIKKELKRSNFSKTLGFSNVCGELYHAWFVHAPLLPLCRVVNGEEIFRNITKDLNQVDGNIDLIEYLIKQEYVQFIIIPENSEEIKIFSKEGSSKFNRTLNEEVIHYSYKILKGKDPLEYENIGIPYGETLSHQIWLEKTIKHDLPDIPHRLFGFFDCKYAPNFVVTSSYDYHFLSIQKLARKKEKLLKDFQTHDGLFHIESVVPLTLAGPGIKKGAEISMGRNIDILPTLLKVLGIDYDPTRIDGEILSEALE
jgi:hypothetical protein